MVTVERTDALEALTRRARRTLDDAGCSLVGRRVLAMCSGGADSVALVAMLGSLARGAAPATIDVLFLDHGLRDVDDERSAARAAARRAAAAFHECRAGVGLDTADGGLEAAARRWRYGEAARMARELGCDVVATGHTADDQLEAALLSLVGVTGPPGRPGAMPVARVLAEGVQLVRPLLGCARPEVEAACGAGAFEWCDDPTNADPDAHVRNAIRARVVPPLLAAHPGAGAALVRAGAREREAAGVTAALADVLLDTWLDGGEQLDVRLLAALPGGARRELLSRWLDRAGLGRARTSRLIAAVDALAVLPGRAACRSIDLPGSACVRRDGYHLRIQLEPRHGSSRQ